MSAIGSESAGPQSPVPGGLLPADERLADNECWELLAEMRFGRLAVSAVGDVDIFPINFVVDGRDIVFRTSEGTKLMESVICDVVAIETDDRNFETGVAWSVVAKGQAEMIERFDDIYAAERLNIKPWVDTPKERFVRVRVRNISGRRFYAAPTSAAAS